MRYAKGSIAISETADKPILRTVYCVLSASMRDEALVR
jgi:hypothetical protein